MLAIAILVGALAAWTRHRRELELKLDEIHAAERRNAEALSAAKQLFVHPNPVRSRLRRIGDVTGHSPADARTAYTLRVALTLGRLSPRCSEQL